MGFLFLQFPLLGREREREKKRSYEVMLIWCRLRKRVLSGVMARVSHDFGDALLKNELPEVVYKFPNYKIDPSNRIIEPKENPKIPSMKDTIAKEVPQLIEKQKRLSVHDLASKFDKGKFSQEATAGPKKLVEEVRAFARPEIENARETMQRVEEVLQLQERIAKHSGKQVMDMEHESQAMKDQLAQKSMDFLPTQKEVPPASSPLYYLSQESSSDTFWNKLKICLAILGIGVAIGLPIYFIYPAQTPTPAPAPAPLARITHPTEETIRQQIPSTTFLSLEETPLVHDTITGCVICLEDTFESQDQSAASSVEEAEARAIRLGLEATARRRVVKALFLSDCITLVDTLCSGASDLPMGARSVIMDIKSMEYCSFSHMSRHLNCTGDSLARTGCTLPAHMCLDPAEAKSYVMFCMGHSHD